MKSQPKVTALIPSYNHGRFIKTRIESILNQSYQNVELIIIDDCSTDDSDDIIRSYVNTNNITYIRNEINTGTPFSAWERAAKLATGDYIWICESDDFAAVDFLETAVSQMINAPEAVLFYCNSWVVDENDVVIGHTDDYFHNTWEETRWDKDFMVDGREELAKYQVRGQTVPNMSSSLIRTDTFRTAYDSFLKRFKLTGDWLFIGWVFKYGKVIFCKKTLSNFRKHEMTARVRVKSAQSQAEFILTKYLLFLETKLPQKDFVKVMKTDAVRFLYEPASFCDLIKALLYISPTKTLKVSILFVFSLLINPDDYMQRYINRYKSIIKADRGQQNG